MTHHNLPPVLGYKDKEMNKKKDDSPPCWTQKREKDRGGSYTRDRIAKETVNKLPNTMQPLICKLKTFLPCDCSLDVFTVIDPILACS